MKNITTYTNRIDEGILSIIKNLGINIWNRLTKTSVNNTIIDTYYTSHKDDNDFKPIKFNASNLIATKSNYKELNRYVKDKIKNTDYGKALSKLLNGKIDGISIKILQSEDTIINLLIYNKKAIIGVVVYNEISIPKPYFKAVRNIAAFNNEETTIQQIDNFVNKLVRELHIDKAKQNRKDKKDNNKEKEHEKQGDFL